MDRRSFLSLMTGLAAAWPSVAHAVARPPMALRRLRLVNCHTGETFDGAYRNDQGPIPRVIDELCVFLRDHHSGEKTQSDVRVDSNLSEAMTKARAMERGGVGWYPHSGFIHIDTGPVRNWTLDERGLDGLLVFDGRRFKIDGRGQVLIGG